MAIENVPAVKLTPRQRHRLRGAMRAACALTVAVAAMSVTPAQATMLINRENAQLLDIREPNEYVAGHPADSRNIPSGSLDERAGELGQFKDTPLILICQSGARSSAACSKLAKLGFAKLHTHDGGVAAWVEAGLPLKKGARK